MATASSVSLHLARFDDLRVAGPVDPGERPGLLFCEVGADCRAAGTDPASREAFTFLVVGLHDSRESADRLVDELTTVAPWFADAAERWSGVLAPFRTKGESNLIRPTAPARLKRQMDRYRATGNADRASFTRLTALRSIGTWHGADPVAKAGDTGSMRRAPGDPEAPPAPI